MFLFSRPNYRHVFSTVTRHFLDCAQICSFVCSQIPFSVKSHQRLLPLIYSELVLAAFHSITTKAHNPAGQPFSSPLSPSSSRLFCFHRKLSPAKVLAYSLPSKTTKSDAATTHLSTSPAFNRLSRDGGLNAQSNTQYSHQSSTFEQER
jgi:hypothetical protein